MLTKTGHFLQLVRPLLNGKCSYRRLVAARRLLYTKRVLQPDPYDVLGVDEEATPEQIRTAYLRLAKQYHPDVTNDNGDQFKLVTEAFKTLTDGQRSEVDSETAQWLGHFREYIIESSFNRMYKYFVLTLLCISAAYLVMVKPFGSELFTEFRKRRQFKLQRSRSID